MGETDQLFTEFGPWYTPLNPPSYSLGDPPGGAAGLLDNWGQMRRKRPPDRPRPFRPDRVQGVSITTFEVPGGGVLGKGHPVRLTLHLGRQESEEHATKRQPTHPSFTEFLN